jgi:fused signal recognition particle receptor
MFDSLKKKLREGVAKLSRKAEAPVEKKPPKPEKVVKKPELLKEGKPARPRPRKVTRPAEKPVREKPVVREPVPLETPKEEVPERPEISEENPEIEKPEPEQVEEEPAPEEPSLGVTVEEIPEEPVREEAPPEEEGAEPEKLGRLARLRGIRERVSTREISDSDIDGFFEDSETEMLQSDVALEVMDSLKEKLKEKLVRSKVKRSKSSDFVTEAFEQSLLEIVDQGGVDLEGMIRKSRKGGKPLLMVFLGFNGSGKTTSIAKCASYIKKKGFRPVLAAGDTFRAASIEQLEVHGERVGVKVIKHQYGSDSAAVIFDAVKYAQKNRLDVVLADTAGRAHTDRNLMDELRKVVRVNSPDLKVLVVDSLTGNDAVEQARQFHEAVGVDCVVMTKTDVNPRGGSILSVVHTIRKPILFLGTGQEYDKVELFSPRKFVRELIE